MDFDSIVSLLLIIAFFVLPSILKQVKAAKIRAGKNSPEASKVSGKKTSIFDKIGEQIRKFIQEIEQQSQQQRQAQKQAGKDQPNQDQENVWDLLGQDEEFYEDTNQAETFVPEINLKRENGELYEAKKESERKKVKRKEQPIGTPTIPIVSGKNLVFKSNQLQNAIVWSEILSKPIALRETHRKD